MARYRSDTGLELDDDDPADRAILDRQRTAAREAGRRGEDRVATTRGRVDLQTAFDEGAAPAAAPASAPKSAPTSSRSPKRGGRGRGASRGVAGIPTPRLTPPKSFKASDASGFLFGLVLHALVVSYIRYGKAGPTGWLKAKFLNRPIQGEDLERENKGGSKHENPDSVPWEDLTPEEQENII